jgi:hypothetical protein
MKATTAAVRAELRHLHALAAAALSDPKTSKDSFFSWGTSGEGWGQAPWKFSKFMHSDPKETELRFVAVGAADLKTYGEQLIAVLEYLAKEGHPQQAYFAMECLGKLICAAVLVGKYAGISRRAQEHHVAEQSAKARHGRSIGDREEAISNAITAANVGWDGKHPVKQADSITNEVNAKLKASGHKKISKHTIYRRLKNQHS